MQPILAIVRLTFQAALRFRLLPLLCVLLVTAVIALPMLVKHDGTAQGFVQIILTYTLASIMGLLGFATVWLACGTLAGDVEDAQIQMVVVKPIARWQIWIGKWLGILLLDAILLGIAAAAVFGMLKWRASQLSPEAQAALRKQIMVADGVIMPAVDVTDEEVEEVKDRMLPSRNLLAASNFKAHYIPTNEFAGGLHTASTAVDDKKPEQVFHKKEDAIRAYREGKIGVGTRAVILSPYRSELWRAICRCLLLDSPYWPGLSWSLP